MVKQSRTLLFISALVLVAQSLTSCSDYWWERGQALSTADLLKRASEHYESAQARYGAERAEFQSVAQALNGSLEGALTTLETDHSGTGVKKLLLACEESFGALEGKLSVGSRAPYGELSGQLRSMVGRLEKGEEISKSAFSLFTARTRFFLANEFAMNQPVTG